jgi:site-specific DNA recombinase
MQKRLTATIAQTADSKVKAVIYIRVSSKEQKEEGFSLDAQLKFLNDYAVKKGMDVVNVYMDVESAKNPGRKEFARLIEFFRGQRDCQTVLVEKTDRFYRNVHDLVTVRELGVTVHLAKEGVVMTPLSKSHEKFTHGLNVLLAERFSNNLSEETQKGMLEKAQQGIWPSYAPLGYQNVEGDNKKRVIEQDPVLAPLVRRMFEQYATGLYSVSAICKEAVRIGLVHRKSGNKVTKSAMYDLLNNPIYYGDFYWKDVLYNGTHAPIITKQLFDKVQEVFNRRSSCPTGRQKHDFLFHGMMTCGHCGCAMVAEIKKGTYVYYHCTGNRGKCPDKYVREELVDQQFTESLHRIQIDDDVADWIVGVMNSTTAEERAQHEASIKALEQQQQILESRLDKMYLDKLDGDLTDDEYRRLANKFRSELTEIKFNLATLKEQTTPKTYDKVRILELAQNAARLYSGQSQEEKRKLLSCVYSNSTFAGGELAANFRKPFDMIAETNDEYRKKKATSPKKSGRFEIWRPSRLNTIL